MSIEEGTAVEAIGIRTGVLGSTPDELRTPIMSGLRWTFWLFLFSIPFSYATNILLARIGPEALGTFGILGIYIALVSVFCYFGGDAVAMKFLPEIAPTQRLAFLVSYLLILMIGCLGWFIAAEQWPQMLRLTLGSDNTSVFQLQILSLAPIYIIFSLSTASLRGMLQISRAQALERTVPTLFFLVLAILYFGNHSFLTRHYQVLIWIIYFGAIFVVTAVAVIQLLRNPQFPVHQGALNFYLPTRFAHYVLWTQGSSVLGFFGTRIELIFVLNLGGVSALGRYLAVMALVSVVPKLSSFLLSSLLPTLTNTLAKNDHKTSRAMTETYIRLSFPVNLAAVSLTLLFGRQLLGVMGKSYADLLPLLIIATPVAGLQSLSWFSGTVISASGRPQHDAAAKVARMVTLVSLFYPLWHMYGLLGAVLSWAFSELAYHVIGVYLLRSRSTFYFAFKRDYFAFGIALLAAILIGARLHTSTVFAAVLWVGIILLHLALAGYSWSELSELATIFFPGKRES